MLKFNYKRQFFEGDTQLKQLSASVVVCLGNLTIEKLTISGKGLIVKKNLFIMDKADIKGQLLINNCIKGNTLYSKGNIVAEEIKLDFLKLEGGIKLKKDIHCNKIIISLPDKELIDIKGRIKCKYFYIERKPKFRLGSSINKLIGMKPKFLEEKRVLSNIKIKANTIVTKQILLEGEIATNELIDLPE
ncbi:MAG: hypothetical protein ACTSPV_11900 [Candidatus Hodarchaeales archaeon]